MNSQARQETFTPPGTSTMSSPEEGPNNRGGQIDIEDKPGKSMVEEAAEESFPASDPPSNTPEGYVDCPPRCCNKK